jgi:hypothetical protein
MFLTRCYSAPIGSKELNDFYTKGWELVSSLTYISPMGDTKFIYYFKRILIITTDERNECNPIGVC